MKKLLLALGLVGLMAQAASAQSYTLLQTPSCCPVQTSQCCPTGAAAPVIITRALPVPTVQSPCLVCPSTGGAAPVAPLMVPVEKRNPWWMFWNRTNVTYQPMCPSCSTCPTQVSPCCPTGAATQIQQQIPCSPRPYIIQPTMTPSGGAAPTRAPIRGRW